MKKTKRVPLWYNPVEKGTRGLAREGSLADMAADREGRALLDCYCRLYRAKL